MVNTDSLLAGVVGALLAAAIGLLGAWIQSRREHKRWLRERRYDAYRRFMVDMGTARSIVGTEPTVFNVIDLRRRARTYTSEALDAFEAVSLLGPRPVNRAGQAWADALAALAKHRGEPSFLEAYRLRRWEFLLAAGHVLGSTNVEPAPPSRRVEQ